MRDSLEMQLRMLIRSWRDMQLPSEAYDRYQKGFNTARDACADELENVLRRNYPPTP